MTPGELKELVEKAVAPFKDQIPGLPERRRVQVQQALEGDRVVVYFDGAVSADDPAADRQCLSGGVSCFMHGFRVTREDVVLYGRDLAQRVRSLAEDALAFVQGWLEANRTVNAAQPAHVVGTE